MRTPEIPLWARLAALIALMLAWPAFAAPMLAPAPHAIGSSLLTPVALKCSRIIQQQGREILINTCGSCRIVKVSRTRPGATAPINRTLTVAPKTQTGLSFKGPGQTRIQSDTPCKPQGAGATPAPLASDNKRCIQMQQTVAGLGLVNPCKECRVAVVERVDQFSNRRQETVAIAGQSAIKLEAKGATGARVLSEKACK
ncbi:MAG: hypothetical protein HQ504_07300 [Rhodospirillaceae bacterium]|nr:hypothetical protein [Rhodospirillaceae bacterium]